MNWGLLLLPMPTQCSHNPSPTSLAQCLSCILSSPPQSILCTMLSLPRDICAPTEMVSTLMYQSSPRECQHLIRGTCLCCESKSHLLGEIINVEGQLSGGHCGMTDQCTDKYRASPRESACSKGPRINVQHVMCPQAFSVPF